MQIKSFFLFQEDKGDYTYVERLRIPLTHGTLLLMEGCTQTDWQVQKASHHITLRKVFLVTVIADIIDIKGPICYF